MGKGLFITLEGGEGSGKTTQIRILAEKLEAKGCEVVLTREPGGTPEAEKIRELLVQREGGDWTPMAECLLLFAARAMHVHDLIAPSLDAGKIVICDRFTDSTRAYQAYGHGLALEKVEELNRVVLDGFGPDLTIIMDIDPEVGLGRSERRLAEQHSHEDRFERLDFSFHRKLREGYLDIAHHAPERCQVVNADMDIETVARDIELIVMERL